MAIAHNHKKECEVKALMWLISGVVLGLFFILVMEYSAALDNQPVSTLARHAWSCRINKPRPISIEKAECIIQEAVIRVKANTRASSSTRRSLQW